MTEKQNNEVIEVGQINFATALGYIFGRTARFIWKIIVGIFAVVYYVFAAIIGIGWWVIGIAMALGFAYIGWLLIVGLIRYIF